MSGQPSPKSETRRRRRWLVIGYIGLFFSLVGGALLLSGLIQTYFAYRDGRSAIDRLQSEQVASAALRIEQFIDGQEGQLRSVVPLAGIASSVSLEERNASFNRVLRASPSISSLSYINGEGREQLLVSRVDLDRVQSGIDRTDQDYWLRTRPDVTYFSAVSLRSESEPHIVIAAREPETGGLIAADINLKFIVDVVSEIKIGQAGKGYVVDPQAGLVAHPDANLVLTRADPLALPQVQVALAAGARGNEEQTASLAPSLSGGEVLTSARTVDPPGWLVVVEQPASEALAPLNATLLRTGALLAIGLAFAVIASIWLARRAVAPIWTAEGLRRFLSPQVANLLASEASQRLLASHRQEIATVFCDLRGFTAFADTHEPADVLAALHEYHQCVGTLIQRYEATVGFFAGDGLMVFFNDPVPCMDPSGTAIRFADSLRTEMLLQCETWRSRGYALGIGMGVSLGEATIGEIGFEGRSDYGIVGTSVNLAARLCAEALHGQILVDEKAFVCGQHIAEMEAIGPLTLKGFQRSILAFNVISIRSESTSPFDREMSHPKR